MSISEKTIQVSGEDTLREAFVRFQYAVQKQLDSAPRGLEKTAKEQSKTLWAPESVPTWVCVQQGDIFEKRGFALKSLEITVAETGVTSEDTLIFVLASLRSIHPSFQTFNFSDALTAPRKSPALVYWDEWASKNPDVIAKLKDPKRARQWFDKVIADCDRGNNIFNIKAKDLIGVKQIAEAISITTSVVDACMVSRLRVEAFRRFRDRSLKMSSLRHEGVA
eukprot:CAMPEP_0175495024 /NCGR_PEP_ID=MMETSP0096-20121207/3583_1 /TAXON_ID=311494 /ORGANISM="Alexandrium monilatum, Strain CCMP3105" /LENGTH=221 /DNA_ID=CAMNT_0016797003 /DNA_START=100 /DNA_END=762 /DNA_ORIENTATION=-